MNAKDAFFVGFFLGALTFVIIRASLPLISPRPEPPTLSYSYYVDHISKPVAVGYTHDGFEYCQVSPQGDSLFCTPVVEASFRSRVDDGWYRFDNTHETPTACLAPDLRFEVTHRHVEHLPVLWAY